MTRRQRFRWVFVIGAVALVAAPLLWELGKDIAYAWTIREVAAGQLKYVEYQPNSDWPKRQVTDAETIEELRSWLSATGADSSFRSNPPPSVCEMRFVFSDGHEEVIHHSPFREPLSKEGSRDYRGDVRVYFKGHWRSGSTEKLVEILEPN